MRHFSSFLILIFLISCSSGKKLSYDELMAGAPSWVKSGPNTPGYYHGVGMASKTGTSDDYREVARQNALSNLASGISVNISSSSVLNLYEFENNYSEYYRENIQMNTQEYLEGYELVEKWESETQYWVYYKLSKQKYVDVKQERIDKSMGVSKSDFDKAREYSRKGDANEAMHFYLKSLEEVKNYLGEDLRVEVDGENEGYASLLISEIMESVQNLRLVYSVTQVKYTRGVGPDEESIQLSVFDENDNPVKGIPVNVSPSYAPGKSMALVSDAKGNVRFKIEPFDSQRKDEYISSKVNVNKMVKDNTSEPVVRRLLQSIKIPEYVLPMEIISPKFAVITTEGNLEDEMPASPIENLFISLLKKDGLNVISNAENADYIIRAQINTKQDSEVRAKFSSALSASFELKNRAGQTLYTENLIGITGLGSTFENAGEDAYKSLTGKIKINIYPGMYKTIFIEN